MAAPTNVAVESNSTTQATVRWVYGGANTIGVWRAPHGGAFSELTLPTSNRVAVGTTTYVDNTAVAGTFYDYKLSDDNGSTFSSVASVVIQTCIPDSGGTSQQTTGPAIPQFIDDADITAQNLQDLGHKVELSLSAALAPAGYCILCSSNGALVLDCTSGCKDFLIITTEDINSISSIGCSQDGTISFIVPANTTRKIAGFAAGSSLQRTGLGGGGYTINAGSTPRQVDVQHSCKCDSRIYGQAYIVYTAAGVPCVCDDRADGSDDAMSAGPTGVGSTGCTPSGSGSGLTIMATKKDGTANPTNSLHCNTDKQLNLQACGGVPPYTWSFTGSINFVGSSTGRATVLPPTNNGSGVAGNAYKQGKWHRCGGGFNQTHATTYGCDDSIQGTEDVTANGGCINNTTNLCGICTINCLPPCNLTLPTQDHTDPTCSPNCDGCPSLPFDSSGGAICDMRTAGMIAGGCNPCGLVQFGAGATVTVHDSVGTSTTIVVNSN